MFDKPTRAIVFSCSLLAATAGSADSYRELDKRLRAADDAEAIAILRRDLPDESGLDEQVDRLARKPSVVGELREIVHRRAVAEEAVAPNATDWRADVQRRKAGNPLYRDDPQKQTGNWLAKAYERLLEAIRRMLDRPGPRADLPSPPPIFGPWLVYVLWSVLGAILLAFLAFVVRHFAWKGRLRRKATALVDEEEAGRTLDEWLTLADQLESAGKFREAVRCLYLACLLKFDEHQVARFDRGETNWEHLARIKASPKLPPSIEFDAPTRSFDRVWYGMITEGKPDVDRFRGWYKSIVDALGGRT